MNDSYCDIKFSLGERVKIIPIETIGIVEAFFIDGNGVAYKVSFWIYGEIKHEYLDEVYLERIEKQ